MNKNNKRVQESNRLINDALLSLMEKKTFSEITISEICRTATVSRNTFYRQFKDKEEVLGSILEEKAAYIINQYLLLEDINMFHPAGKSPRRTYRRMFRFWFDQKPLLQTLNSQCLLWMLDMAYLKALHANGQKAFDILSRPQDPDYFMDYFYFWHAINMSKIIQKWVLRGCKESVEELVTVTIRLQQTMNMKPTSEEDEDELTDS